MFAEQGIITPIVVDRSYRIIDGHLRVMAARELGIDALDALVLSDISDAQRIELELSLNRLAEDGAWDTERLKSKFEQLIEYNVDLTFTGSETAEIDNILQFEVIEPDAQDWTTSDLVTQFGDIWQVGDHIIACGNALSPDEVLGDVLDGMELAKASITDPPYNVPTAGHIRTTQKHAEFAMAAGEMDDQDFYLVQSWDTALTANANSDYSAVTTWARLPSQKFVLLHAKQIKLSSDKLVDAIIQHAQAWSAKHVLVEHANHARDLIQDLQKRANGRVHIKGVPHQNLSKEARLDLVLYFINAGRVGLLRGEKSLDLLLHQLRQFPNGKHDDLVDSFTQALRVLPTLGSGKAVWRIS